MALHDKLFPQLANKRWGEVNFNEVAQDFQQILAGVVNRNLLLDPAITHKLSELVRKIKGVDHCWGGFLEDRSTLWSGHYMKPGEMVHLGIDLSVPAGTEVFMPTAGKLVHRFEDTDQNGGWGGKMIFKYYPNQKEDWDGEPRYMVLGHLKNMADDGLYSAGDKIAEIAETERNGNWSPHLHIQCMKQFIPDVDGYGPLHDGIEKEYFDPALEF